MLCVVLTYCLQAGRPLSTHLVDPTSTNLIAASINLTYRSLNWSAHRGRRWCSRHHALPWGQFEHATFASIVQRSVLHKVMDDSAHLPYTCCISWLRLLFFILSTVSFLDDHFSFNIILCLQQLYRRFGFTVEHEKSDRTLYLNELTSVPQSNKSKKQYCLCSLPPRVPGGYWVIQGTKRIKPSRRMSGMVLSEENHKRFDRYIVRTWHMGWCPIRMSTETPLIRTRFFFLSLSLSISFCRDVP
jgi:hypothetical protein